MTNISQAALIFFHSCRPMSSFFQVKMITARAFDFTENSVFATYIILYSLNGTLTINTCGFEFNLVWLHYTDYITLFLSYQKIAIPRLCIMDGIIFLIRSLSWVTGYFIFSNRLYELAICDLSIYFVYLFTFIIVTMPEVFFILVISCLYCDSFVIHNLIELSAYH